MRTTASAALRLLLPLGLAACTVPDSPDPDYDLYRGDLDQQVQDELRARGLRGDVAVDRAIVDLGDPLVDLGMMLFYTKALSGQLDTACVSCHVNFRLGGGDGLALPLGPLAEDPDLLGPGRRLTGLGKPVPRNAPTMYNSAFWDAFLLWDGRIESLGKTPRRGGNDGNGISTPEYGTGREDPTADPTLLQTHLRFPITSTPVMRGFVHADLDIPAYTTCMGERLGGYGACGDDLAVNDWPREFCLAYDGLPGPDGQPWDLDCDAPLDETTRRALVNFETLTFAIEQYEAALWFTETPYKAYALGDETALSDAAKRGALLFFRTPAQGGANCARCHSGDFFTDEKFHNIGMIQAGPSTAHGPSRDQDWGRGAITGRMADRYAFRTPTLLNVEVTGPFGHTGAYATLEGVIRHHLDPEAALLSYELGQVPIPAADEDHIQRATWEAIEHLYAHPDGYDFVALSDEQVADLVAFVEALTDPCVESAACLAPFDPINAGLPDPDGLRLSPVDADGNTLVPAN
jgi:cytochrome c peroxidase